MTGDAFGRRPVSTHALAQELPAPMIERTFQTAPEPVACPYLGLLDDDRTRFLFATPAHRCHVKRKPGVIDLQHQGRYCLSNEFPACPRFRAPSEERSAATRDIGRRVSSQQRPVISVVETSRPAADALNPIVTADSRPVPSILKPVPEPEPGEAPGGSRSGTASRGSRRLAMVLILAVAVVAFAIFGYALGILPSVDLLTLSTTGGP